MVKRVEKLPDAEKFEEVKKEIIRRNPGFEMDGVFEWKGTGTIKLTCISSVLKDIEPLAVLKKVTLIELNLDDKLLRGNLPIVESLRATLKTINDKPAEEFWKSVGK
jgi:hypothetical protein